jgi:hypothetical protein
MTPPFAATFGPLICSGSRNAKSETITSHIDLTVDSNTRDDVLILSGGTMDVARNEVKNCLRHLTHFLKRTSRTNIILDVPHRFDQVNSSCVNKESIGYNRKLQEIVKTSNHVQMP